MPLATETVGLKLSQIILYHSSVSTFRHAHNHVAKSDSENLTGHTSTDSDHQTELDGETLHHVYSNCCGGRLALMASGKASDDDVVLANPTERVAVVIARLLL